MIDWYACPLTENTLSRCGRYRIVRSAKGCRLYAKATEFERPLMTGTETECRELAAECEDPAWGLVEPMTEPDSRECLSAPGATLVRMAERIAISGSRLEVLLTKRCPPEVVRLEFGILQKWAERLASRVRSLTPESLL